MHPDTLTALQGSIVKWHKIVTGEGPDERSNNCPLCQRFDKPGCSRMEFVETPDEPREHCPVAVRAGRAYCSNTPYEAWARAAYGSGPLRHGLRVYADTSELVALAQAELDFLRSLLPSDAK